MKKRYHAHAHGIPLKKKHGQHFLREQFYIDQMIQAAALNTQSSVLEIGCGDGFLTRSLLAQPLERLWVFEIDPEWASYVKEHYPDKRMSMFVENILDVDFKRFEQNRPWALIANLPYSITFALLRKLVENRHVLTTSVIMIQEEVAQKIVKTGGRGYGFPSLYYQHYFEWTVLNKVPPKAFLPPPKVQSRLLAFTPRVLLDHIEDELEFWQFIKRAFLQPRRTLKNNLQSYHYNIENLPESTLLLRAQQMSKKELIALWHLIKPSAVTDSI